MTVVAKFITFSVVSILSVLIKSDLLFLKTIACVYNARNKAFQRTKIQIKDKIAP